MFSHVTLGTRDVARAVAFYDRALASLGLARVLGDAAQGYAGYAEAGGRPRFWVVRPIDHQPATAGNGTTIAFEAADRAAVDAVHAAILAAGGTDEGGPGLRPHYHADYYGAYARDPDGNKLCVVCHHPAA